MSNWRPDLEDDSGLAALTGWLGDNFHYLSLVLFAAFMLWNRTQSWGRFIVDGEVLFSGNDPWYHYRSVSYAVEHFPANMPFDPWTFFSYGTANSQFGTLYDQSIAAVAMVLGLGSPSDHLVRMVLLFAPVVVGVLILLPAYVIGRRLGGRFAGVMGAAIVAFSSGFLLRRSTVGFSDHHVAEALLQALGVLGIMVAVSVSEREKPIYELVADGSLGVLRRPLAWSVLAGVAVGLYLWVWPPGILLLGIIGVFFLLHLSAQYLRGNSPEPAAFAGVVAMTTTGVMNLATLGELSFRGAGNSLLQPTLAFGVALWCVFMAWLAREWDDRDLVTAGYPLTATGIIVAGVGFVAVALPGLFDRMLTQVLKVIGFVVPQSATVGTIGETQPLTDLSLLYEWHGLAVLLALVGVAIVLVRQYTDDDPDGQELFVVVWLAFIFAAVLTQSRFAYYLPVALGAASAVPIGMAYRYVTSLGDDGAVEGYQVMTILTVVGLVVAPMFLFGFGPIQTGQSAPGHGIVGWEDSLDWMEDNTPAVGTYNDSDGERMDLYGTFAQTDDFDYSAGDYGVVSWWDYGHWITALGERIPNANPFQQGATDAARFLLAQNDSAADRALERVNEDDAKTKYAMIDWKMVNTYGDPVRGKFFAPPNFHPNYTGSDFTEPIYLRNRTSAGIPYVNYHKQAYYQSMAVRLYKYHGSAVDPQPFVVDWQRTQQQYDTNGDGTPDSRLNVEPSGGPMLQRFDNVSAAREYAAGDETSQVGGIGPHPSERVEALENYRLVKQSEYPATASQRYQIGRYHEMQGANVLQYLQNHPFYGQLPTQQLEQFAPRWLQHTDPAWNKVFERVPGATIEGTGPADTEVTARVRMHSPSTNTSFQYVQHAQTGADGEFTMTVPYSTTGYDEWGPENGHTNVSVRATGPYSITTGVTDRNDTHATSYTSQVNVSEAAVIGENTEPITTELEETTTEIAQPGNETGNGTAGNGTAGDGSAGDGTTGNETDGNESGNGTSGGTGTNGSQALAPPSTEVRVAPVTGY